MSDIDISKFCEADDDCGRYALNTPWREGGFIYATDGRRIARIPDDGRDIPVVDGRRPKAGEVFASMPFPESGWMPFPSLPECKCVIGKGTERCGSCCGLGTRECDMGHDHDCDECEGKGRIEVETECECTDRIGGWKFARKVIAPFLEIEGIEIVVVKSGKTNSGNMLLRKGEFVGIAAGLSE